ncbi:unnamed protein product [Nesidiocoris tenuis]|uniref:Uncharacterized protein n=1 Tax=Nesidiocoris tenuis TaxID=355587 RepID=A0A6H5GD31_9HEMI|nr:unnamed protein product [Nesidiocoris tenuis]
MLARRIRAATVIKFKSNQNIEGRVSTREKKFPSLKVGLGGQCHSIGRLGMTHNNVPNELRNERQRLEEGMSDDEDFELIEILDNEIGEDAQEEGADTDEEPDEPIEEDDSYEPPKDDSIRSFAHHRGQQSRPFCSHRPY